MYYVNSNRVINLGISEREGSSYIESGNYISCTKKYQVQIIQRDVPCTKSPACTIKSLTTL